MEIRVLQYFLAVAREQNISAAAESLHLSQPTLSRQLRDMEEELGKQLFIRGNRKIVLTEEGMILRKRAEEILDLVRKTEDEISLSNDVVAGDIFIGAGESEGCRLLLRAAKDVQQEYPDIHIHLTSGDSVDLMERLNKGLYDFAVIWDPSDISNYESLQLPFLDMISLLMPADCHLAKKKKITAEDLIDLPLIISRQQLKHPQLQAYFKKKNVEPNIVASYNLLFNASLMVEEGMGYAIGIDHVVDTTGKRNLVCRPLSPSIDLGIHLVWKKYQVFTKASQVFLQKVQELIETENLL